MANTSQPASSGCGCSGSPWQNPEAAPAWLASADARIAETLDVRPVLAAGGEPFSLIMAAAKRVPAGGVLLLVAPFDPAPLKKVLGKQGFESYSRPRASDHWQVYFHRTSRDAAAAEGGGPARTWLEDGESHIDVRGLPAPQPMLAILGLIDGDPALDALVVHHDREPHFLYPELADRGWTYAPLDGDPGEVRLRLSRLET
jgi:hypothetical protein